MLKTKGTIYKYYLLVRRCVFHRDIDYKSLNYFMWRDRVRVCVFCR